MQMEVKDSLPGAASAIHSKIVTRRPMLCIQTGLKLAGDLSQGDQLCIRELEKVHQMPL